jgi:hypothetical protein
MGLTGPRGKTSKQRIGRCKHATKVMNMRLEGLSYEQIGERMGFSSVRAYHIVKKELGRWTELRNESAAQLHQLEMARLDEMLAAVYPKAKKGDLASMDRVLTICARKAKLCGLDVADKNAAPTGDVVLQFNEVVVTREQLKEAANAKAKQHPG